MSHEAFYDAEIAPTLLDLARRCEVRGLSFAASVEYAPNETGETVIVRDDAGIKIRLAGAAIRCHGNVDSLMMWVARYAKNHGHSSVVLSLMGVPTERASETVSASSAPAAEAK